MTDLLVSNLLTKLCRHMKESRRYFQKIYGLSIYFTDHPPEGSSIYKIVAGIWIFCGLAWLAMVFHMVIFFVRSLTNKISTEDFEIKVVEGHEEVCYKGYFPLFYFLRFYYCKKRVLPFIVILSNNRASEKKQKKKKKKKKKKNKLF